MFSEQWQQKQSCNGIILAFEINLSNKNKFSWVLNKTFPQSVKHCPMGFIISVQPCKTILLTFDISESDFNGTLPALNLIELSFQLSVEKSETSHRIILVPSTPEICLMFQRLGKFWEFGWLLIGELGLRLHPAPVLETVLFDMPRDP